MLSDAALPVTELPCLFSAGGEMTFSLSLSPLDFSDSAAAGAFAAKAVERDRTGLPRWTVSQPSASFRSSERNTLLSDRTLLTGAWETTALSQHYTSCGRKMFSLKINSKKINEIFFSKAFYLKECYWYYRHNSIHGTRSVTAEGSSSGTKRSGKWQGVLKLAMLFLAISWDGKAQQSNSICSSLQEQQR